MDIFKTVRLRWFEIGILKVAMLALGIAIGANWYRVFMPHVNLFVSIAGIAIIYLLSVCVRKK